VDITVYSVCSASTSAVVDAGVYFKDHYWKLLVDRETLLLAVFERFYYHH